MEEQLVVLHGSTFFVSDGRGDVENIGDPNGFFVRDMRHLSAWQLVVGGMPTRPLSTRNLDRDHARMFLTIGWARIGYDAGVTICRDRQVTDRLQEDLTVENYTGQPQRMAIELHYDADFADLFEVKDRQPKKGVCRVHVGRDAVCLRYDRDGFSRSTLISFSRVPASLDGHRAVFDVELATGGSWQLLVEVRCEGDGIGLAPGAAEGRVRGRYPSQPVRPAGRRPRLETEMEALRNTYDQSLVDLDALRFRPFEEVPWTPPAAGLPWFMALFGRDSLITSYQALPFDPTLAAASLQSLALLQARDVDDYRDAQPGKILHELRCGEMARFREAPQSPYYGTHDATSLFLVLLDEYERWTGDLELVRRLEPAARAAIGWIERFGDPDGDGYLEYQARSPQGLVNHYWKDSWNSVMFADGTLAEPPIATCDVQGYAYDARMRAARLARLAWADEPLATRLEADAEELRCRFNRDFWCEERGHYALALDGRKRRVDSMTSNVGQLLWTGIVDEERAAEAVRRLMAPDMFSGWGVRTMSSSDHGYNPIGYHNGTVWPHDSGLVAEGCRRYGFRDEASRLSWALIEAAAFFGHRLPEAFTGFSRDDNPFPVEYPTASRPQAWAAGAPLLALRTLLGLDVVDGELRVAPRLPVTSPPVRLRDVAVRGSFVDITAEAAV